MGHYRRWFNQVEFPANHLIVKLWNRGKRNINQLARQRCWSLYKNKSTKRNKEKRVFRSESIALRRSFLSFLIIYFPTNVFFVDVLVRMILLNLEAPTDILVLAIASHTVIISTSAAASSVQKWIRRVYWAWKCISSCTRSNEQCKNFL